MEYCDHGHDTLHPKKMECNDPWMRHALQDCDLNNCTFMSCYHNKEDHNIILGDLNVFKYLGTALTNQNSIQNEIMGKLNEENACYI